MNDHRKSDAGAKYAEEERGFFECGKDVNHIADENARGADDEEANHHGTANAYAPFCEGAAKRDQIYEADDCNYDHCYGILYT